MLLANFGHLRLAAMRLVGKWYLIPLVLLAVFLATWPFMWWAEPALAAPPDYWYWFLTTITTIGFGDLSPHQLGGRLVFAVVAFTGIAFYGLVVGQISNAIVTLSQRRRKGLVNVEHLKNHVLVYGYDVERTPPLLLELCADQSLTVVLVDGLLTEHPYPDSPHVQFKSMAVMDLGLAKATAAAQAQSVIIDTGDDHQALVLARRLRRQCPNVRIVVALSDLHLADELADLPKVACVQHRLEQMLAREAVSPGVSRILTDYMSNQDGNDVLSVVVPQAWAGLTLCSIQNWVKQVANAVIMGIEVDGQSITNPPFDTVLVPGAVLFYADQQPLPAVALQRPNP